MGLFLAEGHRPIYSISPGATVREALELMAQKNIGALLVMDGPQLAGIFSERDYARKVVLQGRSSSDALVQDIMTAQVITVQAAQNIDECMQIMTDKHVRHLPILEGQRVIGLISIGDVVKDVIRDLQLNVGELTRYIMNDAPGG
jgi:CBS domain-containing protein